MAPHSVESPWPRNESEGGAVGGNDLLPPGLRAPDSYIGPAIPVSIPPVTSSIHSSQPGAAIIDALTRKTRGDTLTW